MAVEMLPVSSSNIKAIGWSHNTLTILFKKGNTYEYSSVPHEVFIEMFKSDSIGDYFHHNIKGHYNSEEI